MPDENCHLILRKLTGSELGWFAEPRRTGKARGRQRGINFNSLEMERIFPLASLQKGDIRVVSTRLSDGQTQSRRIRLQEKNWRLVGDKVSGNGLELLEEGDFFWAEIETTKAVACRLRWDVVTRSGEPILHSTIDREFSVFLRGGMASWPKSDSVADYLANLIGLRRPKEAKPERQHARKVETTQNATAKPANTPGRPMPRSPEEKTPKRKRIGNRLYRPHILAEIVKSGMVLSAAAQADFIEVLDVLSDELRKLFMESKLIQKVEVDQRKAWQKFRGVRISFVDGGMSNVAAAGAAPVALRVGSYTVIPGEKGPQREDFGFEIQLVDDLYETTSGRGIYEDIFEDVAKLRDAARISCEIGGALALSEREMRPKIIFLHGPLVNPVSPYALGTPGEPGAFPNFALETIQKLLPSDKTKRRGRDANFIAIYLEQLTRLSQCKSTVCGVVERASPSSPGPLICEIVEKLHADGCIDGGVYREFIDKLKGYRITDSIIFECILDEGEYVRPFKMDKQKPEHKIPKDWYAEITSYPKPLITYVKANAETIPVRVETFERSALNHQDLILLVVHMSRLLPRYSFPVGLDIVDKHAKIPEWMSRQMNSMLSAQLMRKAMETRNPAAVRLARRILSANTRDWLFRPDFRKG